ncbi:hypothetical protein SAY87_005034 [Trapa incisa]|uniref:WRKY domain-containing protein n=1 Tax=Trapa incisa TaxID=236973 RepID=A0AAN7JQW7_9MYRT|nr:hypothetical protein SAY87_005034 [Trapa incisa]
MGFEVSVKIIIFTIDSKQSIRGMDDNAAIMGDWMPPSPSPRSFFSAIMGDDSDSRSIPGSLQNEAQVSFLKDESGTGNTHIKDCTSPDHLMELDQFSDLGSSSRGGLMERIAARSGFNAPKLNTQGIRPNDVLNSEGGGSQPFLMLSPGLSPTSLLESPVFLSNSLVQPSPTTGKFPLDPSGSIGSSRLVSDGILHGRKENNPFEDNNSSSFSFRPVAKSSPSLFGSEPGVTQAFPQQVFPGAEVSTQSDTSLQLHNAEQPKLYTPTDFSMPSMEKISGNNNSIGTGTFPPDQRMLDNPVSGAGDSPLFDEPQDEEGDQKDDGDQTNGGGGSSPSEDGHSWRKYGQKQVKGSEYTRSYYKCTHPNCQVQKKVERSHEGHIIQIIYKGNHNHPKPPASHQGVAGGPDMQEQVMAQGGTSGNQGWGSSMAKTSAPDWKQESFEMASLHPGRSRFCNQNNTTNLQAQNRPQFEPGDAVEVSSTFSNEEGEDDQANGSDPIGYDAEEDESESKRRKIEAYPTDMTGATRAIREPRVVVQTTSEVDILDDGYRWRKYGQKVVKGNPNPRSYYKCTSAGCVVRKHVERASHDLKSVITTYEGKHNHDVPTARNSSQGNSSGPGQNKSMASGGQPRVRQPEPPAQAVNGIPRFNGSFGLPGRPQQLSHHDFSFALNNAPPGLGNFKMSGLGNAMNGNMPMLPIHPFLAAQHQQQQGQVNDIGLPKTEPVTDPGLNLQNSSSMYQQLLSRLPLGPQM